MDRALLRGESMVLKNANISNKTFEELYNKVIAENENPIKRVNAFINSLSCNNVDKEYLKKCYIELILDQLQANINLASAYGITADDIMKYYNTKYLEKFKK